MTGLDVKAELARAERELEELNAQLTDLEDRRQEVVNGIVRQQGVVHFLQRLNHHEEPKG